MTYILVQQSCNKNEASSFFILAYCELFNQVYILLSPPTPPHLQYITWVILSLQDQMTNDKGS